LSVSVATRALVGPGLAVGVAVVAANALNAVFQFALARILEPAEYSLLAPLVVVTLVAAVPPVAFQATVAREVAVHLDEGRPDEAGAALRSTVRWLSALGAVLTVAAAALYPLIGPAGFATAATVAAALPIPAVWGGLQGAHRFRGLALAHLGFAASRLVAGLAIGLAGGDAAEVMAGVAGATVLTLLASLVPVRSLWRAATAARRVATLPNAAAATGLTVIVALTSADVIVAKLAFDDHTAGVYAAASVGARALLLVPIGVTTVLFPRVATLRDARRERSHLLGGLAVTAVLGAIATAVLWSAASPLIELAFGEEYERAADWVGPLSLAMAVYALLWVYLFHFLALARARFALVLVGVFTGQLAAFGALHDRPAELIGVQIAVAAVALVSAELWYLLRR
jgi:O-antigen/teichoic acid export membrane protein